MCLFHGLSFHPYISQPKASSIKHSGTKGFQQELWALGNQLPPAHFRKQTQGLAQGIKNTQVREKHVCLYQKLLKEGKDSKASVQGLTTLPFSHLREFN